MHIFQHFPDGATDPVSACPLTEPKTSRKRPAARSLHPLLAPCTTANKQARTTLHDKELAQSSKNPDSPIQPETNDDLNTSTPQMQEFTGDTIPKDTTNISSNDKSVNTEPYNTFMEKVLSTDETCFFYTGIPNLKLLHWLFQWITPAAKTVKLWDGKRRNIPGRKGGKTRSTETLFKEMILCLVKIRNGFDNHHLSFLFKISVGQISKIFLTWVNLLHQCLKDMLIWPTKDIVKENLPPSFDKYPNTRAIIDCTEYHVQKPLRPAAQKATWSNYKHANTVKQLVSISPNGAITFLSDTFPGSISDVAIVKESGFVEMVQEGDDIMADRGFNIRHLLLPKKATLNIPAFTHGKVLSHKAVRRSRKIASVRIHVERAIRRMKTFRILTGIIPLKFRFLLRQITTIVAVLCNFQPCLA